MTSRSLFPHALALMAAFKCVSSFQNETPDKQVVFDLPKLEQLASPAKKPPFTIADDIRFPNTISSEVLGARPLSESVQLKTFIPPHKPVPRKLFGFDEEPTEYWFHNKIHTFGNTNVFGAFHAACAPMATRLIDDLAYEGVDVRAVIANELRQTVNKKNAYVIDLCCGVGMSTRALAKAFQDADFICGIDTSPEMIAMARYITKHNAVFNAVQGLIEGPDKYDAVFHNILQEIKSTAAGSKQTDYPNCMYAIGNAERISAPKSRFDLVTIMYAFHEIPKSARSRILREARRLLAPGGTLAVVDISPEGYSPSPSMLAGEPYVLEYQQNINRQIKRFRGFHDLKSRTVIPGALKMWTLTRNSTEKKKALTTKKFLKVPNVAFI